MPYAVHQGVRIWYETVGSGPALILLQGLGLSGRFWMELPGMLADRFQVITLDNRGTGQSDKPGGLYSISGMAQDTLAVADALGLRHFAVAGISMGGMIAQETAIQAKAGRVNGLVLMATTCGLPKGRIPPIRSFIVLLQGASRSPERMKAVRRLIVSAEALDANPDLFRDFERIMAQNPTPAAVFLRQLFAASLHNTGSRLGQIQCPTLVVTGDQDRLILPENSRILAKLIPDATLEVIAGAGHAFPLERKELLAKLIPDFLLAAKPA